MCVVVMAAGRWCCVVCCIELCGALWYVCDGWLEPSLALTLTYLHFLPLFPPPNPYSRSPPLQPSLIAAINEFRFRPDQVALDGGVRELLAQGLSVYSAHPGNS